MSARNVANVVGVVIWVTFAMLFLSTRDQLFFVLASMAIMCQVLTSVMFARR